MKYTSCLLAATLLCLPGSESFRSVSLSLRHKPISIDSEKSLHDTIHTHTNRNTSMLYNRKQNAANSDRIAAREAEAQKICPRLPPPEDVHATFEAAMG